MKMSIGDDYYIGIYFREDPKYGEYEVPDDVAEYWLTAEASYQNAQNEAIEFSRKYGVNE